MRSLISGIALLLSSLTPLMAERDAVALAGHGYGRLEIDAIIREVIGKTDQTLNYMPCDGWIDAEEYDRYRMVIIASDLEKRYTSEELTKIENYVEEGGILVLIHQAPKVFKIDPAAKDTDEAFLFGMSYAHHQQPSSSILIPNHPLLAGAFEEGMENNPLLLNGDAYIMLKNPAFENILGSENFVLVGSLKKGKGEVIFLGYQLFRILSPKNDAASREEAGRWVTLLGNVLRYRAQ